MRPSKQSPARPALGTRPKSQPATGKLKSFRPLPYHIALNQAARLEAWMQEVDQIGGAPEATDTSDFDPRLMEERW